MNRKGFTLVELLAVIIILAIVVGITIPAVLTTINNTREKAFKTAADSVAEWFDKQYQVTLLGDNGTLQTDSNYAALCVRSCYNSTNNVCLATPIVVKDVRGKTFTRRDYYNSSDSEACNCNCDRRLTYLTPDVIVAAGLNRKSIQIKDDTVNTSDNYTDNGLRVREMSNNYYLIKGTLTANVDNKYAITEDDNKISRVYINPTSGRSCVTLYSVNNSNGDYLPGKVACGGACQDADNTRADYCKET